MCKWRMRNFNYNKLHDNEISWKFLGENNTNFEQLYLMLKQNKKKRDRKSGNRTFMDKYRTQPNIEPPPPLGSSVSKINKHLWALFWDLGLLRRSWAVPGAKNVLSWLRAPQGSLPEHVFPPTKPSDHKVARISLVWTTVKYQVLFCVNKITVWETLREFVREKNRNAGPGAKKYVIFKCARCISQPNNEWVRKRQWHIVSWLRWIKKCYIWIQSLGGNDLKWFAEYANFLPNQLQ